MVPRKSLLYIYIYIYDLVEFALVEFMAYLCRLFNAKFCLYIYITYLYMYRLSPWSGWTGFLPSKYSISNHCNPRSQILSQVTWNRNSIAEEQLLGDLRVLQDHPWLCWLTDMFLPVRKRRGVEVHSGWALPLGVELRALTIGDDTGAGRVEEDGGSGDDVE